MNLLVKTLIKFITGLIFVYTLLFIPAGTFYYINGLLFIMLLFIPILILGIVLFFKDPKLLEKRLNGKEDERTQKGVVAVSGLLFVAGFIVAGLDFRFGWSYMPKSLVVAASIVLLISYAVYAEIMRENSYLSRTIKIQKNQKVIDSGLYGIVRHPMYSVTLWLFYAIPIVLGSWWSLLCFLPYIAVIAVRIENEERLLEKGLEGYAEYKKRVKYKVIPFIW